MMQGVLPLNVGLLYECANPNCFYEGSLLDMENVDWKEYWCHESEDFQLRSVCRSCGNPMMIWSDE